MEENNITTLPVAQTDESGSSGMTSYDYTSKLKTLTKEDREHYLQVASDLKMGDVMSVNMYGAELSSTIANNGESILSVSRANSGSKVIQLTNDLLVQLKQMDDGTNNTDNGLRKFLRGIPGMKKLMKTVDGVKVKYNTINDNINDIVIHLNRAKIQVLEDTATIDVMYANNKTYLAQLRELIIAGKVKLEEAEEKLSDMQINHEQYEMYEIHDMSMYRDALARRVADLEGQEYIIYQDIFQLGIVKKGNMSIVANADTAITHGVSVWKQQAAKAKIFEDQKLFATAIAKTQQTTDDILLANVETMRESAIIVANAAERRMVSDYAINKSTDIFIETVKKLNDIKDKGEKNLSEYERICIDNRRRLDNVFGKK